MATEGNKFDIYSSKVKRVNIPIPEFKFFHKASSEEEVDPKFIGREQITDKLYSWLKDDPTGGSYLVTGFRGMGKSSFVGRVLNELTQKVSGKEFFWGVLFFVFIFIMGVLFLPVIYEIANINYYVQLFYIIIIACLNYCIINFMQNKKNTDNRIFVGITMIEILISYYCLLRVNLSYTFIFSICLFFFPLLLYKVQSILYNIQNEDKKKYEGFKSLLEEEYKKIPKESKNFRHFYDEIKDKIDWKQVCRVLYREYNINRSHQRICISVNLGQEVLNERDVLSLISHQLYTKYREYVLSPIANFYNWLIYTILIFISTYPLCTYKVFINEGEIKLSLINIFDVIILLSPIVIILVFYFVSQLYSSSQIRILRRLHLLNNRLDAQVTFNEAYMAGIGKPYLKSAYSKAGYTKKRFYDVAKVREIEQELIDVLNSISKTFWKWKKSPSFIFVFDELDKVDSSSLQGYAFDNQTEFSNEKNFPGGGTTRRRKKNVLHLLANMKLFVSTAKAKFIFISGRELYDAYLADLSDREFAVSSIFSGVIYVDSFCVNEHKGKDVMSNVETYICKQLIPQDYIKKQFARYYAMELVNGAAFDRFDINLKLYYQYLVDVYKDKVGDSFLEPFKEEPSYTSNVVKNYLYRSYIEKAVNLLYHFSVYLYHISNGSPKKMMLYFEKYVKKCYDQGNSFIELHDEISNPNPDGDINILSKDAPHYYLSFGYTDQRKIGFIHYLSYPVNQILVNANQYSDKLLVSVSFLVDHIYKYHNGGFSWRNLEYTPELLEVYKIPGFRSFINSIISYLQQTHLDAITCGLYQFKFRKQIADEISLASKFSEEIAALFNFTLDESLNVKQHYSDIRNAYLELEGRGDEQTPKHTPRLSIGLHNILGDLYMFDEEFNNAIFEYHAAVKELEKEMDERKDDYPDLRNTLYSIQLLLKLGLANEKRNTNESALTVYNELVAKLIAFRHFDEKQLQLTYRLQKHFDWPSYDGFLVPKKYDYFWNLEFNEVHPRIANETDSLLHHNNMPFMASGQHLSTAFAHLLTPEKYTVMQRLSLFQDSRIVYQALLAKLFVKEKIGLGGITITDIETIESEYNYLNLATNTTEKFLSSSDFFRRLGDIMFYKNGLTVTPSNNDGNEDDISFVNGLYYWGYDIKRELLDFCNANNCYEHYDTLLTIFMEIKNHNVEKRRANGELYVILYNLIKIIDRKKRIYDREHSLFLLETCKEFLSLYFEKKSPHVKMLKYIPIKEVLGCNKHRQNMIRCNRPVPCFACNYYSRSMRILMRGMFDCEILEKRIGKSCSVFIIMEMLLIKGTSRSLRQDYVIQLAEILDCRANVLLSCATEDANKISPIFMQSFLSFIDKTKDLETKWDNKIIKEEIDKLEKECGKISKLEECIIYYWEASKCFSIGNDLMKASTSLKKILRVFQNYLKTSNVSENIERIQIMYQNIDDIKIAFVKPSLMYLYSHYNNINFAEIQKLKWVFSVQTYEDIPLNRLSLFPDVEQILLLYYDLLRRSVMTNSSNADKTHAKDLSNIYHNTILGSLRQDSTIYERVMALRFKTLMNNELLHKIGMPIDLYYNDKHEEGFTKFLVDYLNSDKNWSQLLGEYNSCFRFALSFKKVEKEDYRKINITEKMQLLEFLIKDSLFCLTRILEVITPHTSSTLFSNSFYGEIYQMVYEWYMLFDELFLAYKYFDKNDEIDSVGYSTYKKLIEAFDKMKEDNDKKNKIEKIEDYFEKWKDGKQNGVSHFERFFNENTHEIGKAQANYTFAKYSLAMAKESYERTLQMHHEGKAYKDMISQMYYLDDDLKNDTIQFTLAVERYKINNGYIQRQLEKIQRIIDAATMYDINNFANDNMNSLDLKDRFYLPEKY